MTGYLGVSGHDPGEPPCETNVVTFVEGDRPLWDLLSADERALTELLLTAEKPVGAARAHRHLVASGSAVSQATVSRMLLRLDELGVTEGEGRNGRRLTEPARLVLVRASQHRRRNALIDDMFDEADRSELIDLLALRKVVEIEAADLACGRASRDDHQALRTSLEQYDQNRLHGGDFSRHAIEFHVLLCQAAHSAPYAVVAEALYPEVNYFEPLVVAAAHRVGQKNQSSAEHAAIVQAVIRGDRKASRRLTGKHFDTMISWLTELTELEFEQVVAEVDVPPQN
ncbi:DNA-binding FadR family transcriptional regulator [Tamaricihabitans halophyticus]|uniref:DNA-binding FadR family transcriptional regulator n=1 Tax=Tamaricihabitans halophyticus TaxID=1262583 RepID=A0A4R2Q313_9PSEU|nr:DNA-binding FadR family transcriptional regulator [Tamaricihabitans halophyticus]